MKKDRGFVILDRFILVMVLILIGLLVGWFIESDSNTSKNIIRRLEIYFPSLSNILSSDDGYLLRPTETDLTTYYIGGEIESRSSEEIRADLPRAQNVILFIGDGMGGDHRKAARWSSVGIDGSLVMDDLGANGYVRTYCANNPITDSGAAATAMASGVKTNKRTVGLDMNMVSVPTILEIAQNEGKSVGLVTTTMLAHATPAAFAAHIESRDHMQEIAMQLISSGADVLLGGGEDDFYPPEVTGCFSEPGERKDGKNRIKKAEKLGYVLVCDAEALKDFDSSSGNKLIGLFADEGMREPYSPSLAEMTYKAIEVLSQNPEGFFLMVEGGQIDWSAHSNNADGVIRRTLSFDNAIRTALEFEGLEPETLIIVTADHETGGMTAGLESLGKSGEDGPYAMPDGTEFYVNWTWGEHTPVNVPVTASGPLSHWLNGTNDNTYIYDLISSALFGIEDFNTIYLPPDIDGNGSIDHPSVCPWDGNWYISDGVKRVSLEAYSVAEGD